MIFKDEFDENILFPIEITEAGKTIVSKSRQQKKARSYICFIVLGTVYVLPLLLGYRNNTVFVLEQRTPSISLYIVFASSTLISFKE